MEAVTDVDSTATESLLELVAEVHRRDVGFAVARLRQPVAEYLDRAGVLDLVGRDRVYLQVDDAVAALRDTRWQGAGQKAAGAVSSSSSQEDRS